MSDAFNAAREGMQRVGDRRIAAYDDMTQRRTARAAGNALQSGDYGAASNALFQGGDLQGGMTVQNAGRTRQTADREQQRTALLAVVTGLRQVPAEQRSAALAQIAPRLSVYGVTPDQLATITPQDLSDPSLDSLISTMGGEVQRPRIMQGYRGSLDSVDPYSGAISQVRGPQQQDAPTGYRWKPDGTLEIIPGYVQGQDAVADARRAPPRARSSGGGSAPRPAAAPSRPPWERF